MNGRYGQVVGCGGGSDLPAPAPNPGLEPTAYSLRYAPAFGSGSGPAFGTNWQW